MAEPDKPVAHWLMVINLAFIAIGVFMVANHLGRIADAVESMQKTGHVMTLPTGAK